MEDPAARRSDAVTFAVLSLIVRLIATQSSIINLWYSRRCYERSRGEMITMIFEKTLGRKIISAPTRHQDTETTGLKDTDISMSIKGNSRFHPALLWRRVCRTTGWLSWSRPAAKEVKEPASMGKILNLMRYTSSRVSMVFYELINR